MVNVYICNRDEDKKSSILWIICYFHFIAKVAQALGYSSSVGGS